MAKLHFRYGAMNCGKTTRIIQEAHNYESRKLSVIIAKPAIDTKGKTKIISRIEVERPVDVLIAPGDSVVKCLSKYLQEKPIACVFIDEAQFLEPSQVDEFYWEIAQDRNIPVIAYGLRADFLSHPFPGSERLMTLADELEELPTVCHCGKKARFNARTVNGKYVFTGEQVAIDGEGVKYDSLCKNCYRREYLAHKDGGAVKSRKRRSVVTSAL